MPNAQHNPDTDDPDTGGKLARVALELSDAIANSDFLANGTLTEVSGDETQRIWGLRVDGVDYSLMLNVTP